MRQKTNLSDVNLYREIGGWDFFIGYYKNGSKNYFRTMKDLQKWEIIAYGSKQWNFYNHNIHNSTSYVQLENNNLLEWMPEIPSLEELNKVPEVKTANHIITNGKFNADEFPNIKQYFEDNRKSEETLFIVLKEDMYETYHGDGIYRFLGRASFNKECIENYINNITISHPLGNSHKIKCYLKEHTLKYENNYFTVPDYAPLAFEHYEVGTLLKLVEQKLGNIEE